MYQSIIEPIVEVATDVAQHWWSHGPAYTCTFHSIVKLMIGIFELAPSFMKRKVMLRSLHAATTAEEFVAIALELDRVCGNNAWKRRFECDDYDYNIVRDFLDDLYQARYPPIFHVHRTPLTHITGAQEEQR